MSIEIKRSDKYVDYNISATNNRGYITIDTSDWINKPWMFYELPSLKFEIYTETGGELVKYQNFTREIRTYNPVYSPLGVLNVTIDIRNVPEEFILRITPIFDNDAVNARNMLIENGIEDGEIWGSDQDVPTQLFNLNLEFIECDGEYVPPIPPVPPTHEETITGVPPITFDGSTGEPLVSWTILGNSSQSGTPSPDNITMPEFVGIKTANLFDKNAPDRTTTGYIKSDGSIQSSTSFSTSGYIQISGFETITLSGYGGGNEPAYCLYDSSKEYISGSAYIGRGTVVLTVGTAAFIRMSYRNTAVDTTMLNAGSPALPYEPFGYKIPITCAEQTTPVYLGEVQTVRKIRKLVFDGTENWNYSTTSQAHWIANIPNDYNNTAYGTITTLCTHYRCIENNTGFTGMINGDLRLYARWTAPTVHELYIKDDAHTSANDFKAFLADQYASGTPVTVWYVLAEPETAIVNEPLAKIGDYADELSSTNAGVTIQTTEGQNTLTISTDLQPSSVTITYVNEGQ